MELSPDNLVVIGIIASVATQALRLVARHLGYIPTREVANLGLFVLSVGLSSWFFGLPLVGATDPSALAQALIQAAAAVFGSAALIYNVLLEKVLLPAGSEE